MSPLQILNVTSMNEGQLISFADAELRGEHDRPLRIKTADDIIEWVRQFIDKDFSTRKDFSIEAIKSSIREIYPECYAFDSDTYVSCLELHRLQEEEEVTTFEAQNLPLLGGSLVYHSLDRILCEEDRYDYIPDELHDENTPNYVRICSVKRISFADYRTMLLVEQVKIAEMLLRLDKPAE